MSHINSGCSGINITQNPDTALPCPYARLIVGTRHCRVLAYDSGTAGVDISPQATAVFGLLKIL